MIYLNSDILVVTTNEVPGKTISDVKGVVSGISVRTPRRSLGFLANLKLLIGGNKQTLSTHCSHSREQAYLNMLAQARKLGANAIIAMRYDSSPLSGQPAHEIFCYGTAVYLAE